MQQISRSAAKEHNLPDQTLRAAPRKAVRFTVTSQLNNRGSLPYTRERIDGLSCTIESEKTE